MEDMKEGLKPLCETCGVSFSNKSYLKIHVQIVHEKIRPFKCQYCDKEFSVNFSLNRHISQVHTKQKPYQCHHCSLAFSDYTTRYKHERAIHAQTRPYKCICGKSFSYSNVLKAHLKTHSKEEKFVCAVCNQEFSQKHNLQTHLKNVHLFKEKSKEEQKPLGPLFIDTNLPPPIMPLSSTAVFLPPSFVPPLEVPQIPPFNLTGFTLINPSQILNLINNPLNINSTSSSSSQPPLKVIFANI